MSHKYYFGLPKQAGAATLIITVILILSSLLVIIFAANNSLLEQKSVANQYMANQAFMAAEAGLEFGIVYLNTNNTIILASALSGVLNYGATDSNLTNVVLANGSKFSVVYTNPTVGNLNILQVTSTGTSADGLSTYQVTQQVEQSSALGSLTALSVGNIILTGSAKLINTITNVNVQTGGTFNISNGSSTVTSTGTTSTQGNIGSDVVQNISSLQGLSESTYFNDIFGNAESTVKNAAIASSNYYNNYPGNDYSYLLVGKTGVTIWIDQNNGSPATLGHGLTFGTAANPIVLIVEGDLTLANGITLYGFVYASGPSAGLQIAGGAIITGGIASANTITMSNNAQVTYQNYSNLSLPIGAKTYAKIPGTWRDF